MNKSETNESIIHPHSVRREPCAWTSPFASLRGLLSRVPIISIIDDDASVRSAAARIVQSMDLVACTFSSGPGFLDSPQLHETSCIITDVQMPGMNGLELQRVLSTRGFTIPMIFITAYPDEKIRTQALFAGAICFLDKPFDGTRLAEYIYRALGRSG